MKIKKISILGFKSFMDRLEVTLPGGISGVVGPNGCGKSNIVDAIRWCMGEQSPKQLRGRRMEDVIFNGAGDSKPLGMAEVSLVFENGDGSFPPPYANDADISVTRRLYRSGESEYRINNVSCRLKDIQEIFMDTGLGNRPYSIIGQGQIGTILEQRPEETRIMLEEAAGITKYRKKVEASQRKIELAEANLQRVEDIQGEVQRQMRSLKRQASKARRYKRLCGEIQNLELVIYANTFRQLVEDSGLKLRSKEGLIQDEIAKSTELAQLHAQIESMNLELEEKDKALAQCRNKHLNLKERVHKKEVDLESLAGEIRMQKEIEARLKGEQEDIGHRLIRLKEEKTGIQKDREAMKFRSQRVEAEIALREKRLGARRELLKRIKEDYERAGTELGVGKTKEVGLNHESGYLHKMLDQITDSRSRLQKEIIDVRNRMESVTKASERKGLAREAAVERLRDVEALIAKKSGNCEELESDKLRLETEIKSAETNLNRHQSRFASLKAIIENYEGYKMGVRTIMKAKDLESHQQGHILGLVADVLHVDPKYEEAVEVVLADRLQYVIVKTQDDGKNAIEYLKKKARGRGSFVPLRDLNGRDKISRVPTPYPLLKDLVSVPQEFRPLFDVLLGDTAVVGSLEEALSAWRQNGKDLSFVTLEGDMVDKRGVISGGKLAQRPPGFLARKREVVQLREKSTHYKKELDRLKHQLRKIFSEMEKNKKTLEDLTDAKWNCQDEINEFDKMLFRLGQELDQLEKLSRELSEEMEKKEREHHGRKEELLKVERELQQCQERRREEEAYFQKKRVELEECENEFEQLREDLAKLRSDGLIFREEQRSLTREMERLDDYVLDAGERLKKIDEEICLAKKRQEAAQRGKETLREELGVFYERLGQADEDVSRADRERQSYLNEIKEREGKAEQLRVVIEELKERANAAKMEYSETQFKIDKLVGVVREKFNLDLVSIQDQYVEEDFSRAEREERLKQKRALRERFGEVNLMAIKEHEALKERFEFIKEQREDLIRSIESLRTAIKKINRTSLERFKKTFHEVDQKLKEIFPILFNGGTAGLKLTDEARPLDSGVLVEVQPPGKKLSHMGLLSGGEKALVAMAFLFSVYMIKPSPFCLLDEVDSPLDEANVDRFNRLLKEIKRASQIIMVTHSRKTMEITDRLYGITMEKAGISKIVSVDIQRLKNEDSA